MDNKLKSIIRDYTCMMPDGKIRSGKQIVYYDENDNEVTIEEYYGNTAEEWVEKFLTSLQIVALQRLEQNFIQLNKPLPPKLMGMKNWLESILLTSSLDPKPKFDWAPAPYTYEETSKEAAILLNS